MIFPANEKTRSVKADDAEIAKYFLANLARVGYANWCRLHPAQVVLLSGNVLPAYC